MGNFSRILSWPLRKLAFAALLTVLGLVGAGLWIFLHEAEDFEAQQRTAVRALRLEASALKQGIADADRRLAAIRTEISAQQLRADQAAKVARDLAELSSGLTGLTTDAEQLKENEVRSIRMKEMAAHSRERLSDFGQSLVQRQWEKDGLEIALERNRVKLATVEAEHSALLHYARAAWVGFGKWVLAGVCLVLIAPAIGRLVRFYRD